MENSKPKPRPNLMDCISFWKNKSVKEDKGGTFDLDLYLAYLKAINADAPITQANRSNVKAYTLNCNF